MVTQEAARKPSEGWFNGSNGKYPGILCRHIFKEVLSECFLLLFFIFVPCFLLPNLWSASFHKSIEEASGIMNFPAKVTLLRECRISFQKCRSALITPLLTPSMSPLVIT